MDKKTDPISGNFLAWQYLIGNRPDPLHFQLAHDCDPKRYLSVPKTIKFMSKQDRLAVNAAGQALESAALNFREQKDSLNAVAAEYEDGTVWIKPER